MLYFLKKWLKSRLKKAFEVPDKKEIMYLKETIQTCSNENQKNAEEIRLLNSKTLTIDQENQKNAEEIKLLKSKTPALVQENKNTQKLHSIEHDLLMPKYIYHSPLDYNLETHAPVFSKEVYIDGEPLPFPPPHCRAGYATDDVKHYFEWGKYDHDFIMEIIKKHYGIKENISILDWGCSSGRVLRHFYNEHKTLKWKLYGIDIQAFLVEWMRRYFPPVFDVSSGSTIPHLPYRDASLDVIYGISVFTHTKHLWDMWLLEFRRVLKPGGLCIQTVQCETAWKFYHDNRNLEWVKNGHPQSMLEKSNIDEDFFFYGDAFISQTFYREEVVKRYWGRYMKIVDFLPPPKNSYQNWIILQNS